MFSSGADVCTPVVAAANGSGAGRDSKAVSTPVRTSEIRPRSSARANSIADPTRGLWTRPPGDLEREATYGAPMHWGPVLAGSGRPVLTMRRHIPPASRRNVHEPV